MLVHAVGHGSAQISCDLYTASASQKTDDTLGADDTLLGGHLVMCIELLAACD